jgi:hypothetical protein
VQIYYKKIKYANLLTKKTIKGSREAAFDDLYILADVSPG